MRYLLVTLSPPGEGLADMIQFVPTAEVVLNSKTTREEAFVRTKAALAILRSVWKYGSAEWDELEMTLTSVGFPADSADMDHYQNEVDHNTMWIQRVARHAVTTDEGVELLIKAIDHCRLISMAKAHALMYERYMAQLNKLRETLNMACIEDEHTDLKLLRATPNVPPTIKKLVTKFSQEASVNSSYHTSPKSPRSATRKSYSTLSEAVEAIKGGPLKSGTQPVSSIVTRLTLPREVNKETYSPVGASSKSAGTQSTGSGATKGITSARDNEGDVSLSGTGRRRSLAMDKAQSLLKDGKRLSFTESQMVEEAIAQANSFANARAQFENNTKAPHRRHSHSRMSTNSAYSTTSSGFVGESGEEEGDEQDYDTSQKRRRFSTPDVAIVTSDFNPSSPARKDMPSSRKQSRSASPTRAVPGFSQGDESVLQEAMAQHTIAKQQPALHEQQTSILQQVQQAQAQAEAAVASVAAIAASVQAHNRHFPSTTTGRPPMPVPAFQKKDQGTNVSSSMYGYGPVQPDASMVAPSPVHSSVTSPRSMVSSPWRRGSSLDLPRSSLIDNDRSEWEQDWRVNSDMVYEPKSPSSSNINRVPSVLSQRSAASVISSMRSDSQNGNGNLRRSKSASTPMKKVQALLDRVVTPPSGDSPEPSPKTLRRRPATEKRKPSNKAAHEDLKRSQQMMNDVDRIEIHGSSPINTNSRGSSPTRKLSEQPWRQAASQLSDLQSSVDDPSTGLRAGMVNSQPFSASASLVTPSSTTLRSSPERYQENPSSSNMPTPRSATANRSPTAKSPTSPRRSSLFAGLSTYTNYRTPVRESQYSPIDGKGVSFSPISPSPARYVNPFSRHHRDTQYGHASESEIYSTRRRQSQPDVVAYRDLTSPIHKDNSNDFISTRSSPIAPNKLRVDTGFHSNRPKVDMRTYMDARDRTVEGIQAQSMPSPATPRKSSLKKTVSVAPHKSVIDSFALRPGWLKKTFSRKDVVEVRDLS
ncbi:hypothetical protein HDU76_013655 [Blyttiomyces sp. JEL0837]|nr:hypothetical protein HDU76_013655 [Blyttiomyces sp. JEL0837]